MQNLTLRVLSGSLLASIFLFPVFLPPRISSLFCISLLFIVAFSTYYEWKQMTKSEHPFIGLYLTLVPALSLSSINWNVVLAYFCLLWSVDTFAFVGGKIFGGPKLAPKISPNKTWAGLLCGTIACCAALHIITLVYHGSHKIHLGNMVFSLPIIKSLSVPVFKIFLGVAFAVLAQTGDLFVSSYKRKFNVKNTGNFIPGHGGILDRFDGTIFTAPTFCAFLHFYLYVSR